MAGENRKIAHRYPPKADPPRAGKSSQCVADSRRGGEKDQDWKIRRLKDLLFQIILSLQLLRQIILLHRLIKIWIVFVLLPIPDIFHKTRRRVAQMKRYAELRGLARVRSGRLIRSIQHI